MEPHKRTHLVNELMQEANLMMAALEKAMEGERVETSFPAKHEARHSQGLYSLEDEHKTWGKVLKALTDIQTALEQIEHAEHQRLEGGTSSAHPSPSDDMVARG